MRQLLGLILCIASVVVGLYLGVWVMFVGGIIQIVQSITPIIIPVGIGLGFLRFFCSGIVGWLSFYLMLGFGIALLQ